MIDDSPTIDQKRYRRILLFFAGIIAHLILIDLLLGRIPIIRRRVRSSRPGRLRNFARRFRSLAAEMGGVMIKLGQFLSARVDVLPAEITEELVGLQDEVPAVSYSQIETVLMAELGDISRHFTHFKPQPLAAASLGQAHLAELVTTGTPSSNGQGEIPSLPPGEQVVVKVQRPGIVNVVRTDLAALQVVARWAMRYRPIRRRANVPALMDEFARTLWEELDYRTEAANAERFALMFAQDHDVRIPVVYWQHSTERVLTLQNVAGIKIDDVAGMENAGISPAVVSERLINVYFRQIFQEGFFHADPHAGNIFVRPLPLPDEPEEETSTPFEIAFVDFGMVGRVKELMGDHLRQVLVSVVKQDAHTLTEVYSDMGFFLPGADLERIEEAQAEMLSRIWGRSLLEMARPDPDEVRELSGQFKDILREFPFQVPQDFVYLGRAMGMISGLTTQLYPDINMWALLEQFARQIIGKEAGGFSKEFVLEELRSMINFPRQMRRLLQAAERGELRVRTVENAGTARRLDRMERKVNRLNTTLIAAATLIGGSLLYTNGDTALAILFWLGAGLTVLWSALR